MVVGLCVLSKMNLATVGLENMLLLKFSYIESIASHIKIYNKICLT